MHVVTRLLAMTEGLTKASRSASMAVKASAYSEPRGSLCSTRCQPSAAESCSPTPAVTTTMLFGPL